MSPVRGPLSTGYSSLAALVATMWLRLLPARPAGRRKGGSVETDRVTNLVLAIRLGEPLQVGDVTFTILEAKSRTNFRVAVEAPKSVKVSRKGYTG